MTLVDSNDKHVHEAMLHSHYDQLCKGRLSSLFYLQTSNRLTVHSFRDVPAYKDCSTILCQGNDLPPH